MSSPCDKRRRQWVTEAGHRCLRTTDDGVLERVLQTGVTVAFLDGLLAHFIGAALRLYPVLLAFLCVFFFLFVGGP